VVALPLYAWPAQDPTSYVLDGHSPGSQLGRPYHWFFAEAEPATLTRFLAHGRRIGRERLAGIEVTIRLHSPFDGMSAHHVSVAWVEKSRGFLVSLHNTRNRAYAVQLAREWIRAINRSTR
jgi:hypothetical protein